MSKTIAEYKALITSQYQSSPKFLGWLQAVLEILEDASGCADNLHREFDIDRAIADLHDAPLDILGSIVGVARQVSFEPSGGASPILDNETYRIAIRAKIAKNHWDGKIGSLKPIWEELFPGGHIIVQDNQNMSLDVILAGTFTAMIVDLIENGYIVPKPEGVKINYAYGTQPYLGFDLDNDYIAGFDTGNWT